jgi:hypothetical protein
MTTDDILRMAREAGLHSAVMLHIYGGKESALMESERDELRRLERFAALLRDRMISEGWRQCAQGQRTTQHCGMVEQEREACARVCESLHIVTLDTERMGTSVECAAAIRARGQPDPKVTHLNEWARDRLARHGIQIPEDEDGNPSF